MTTAIETTDTTVEDALNKYGRVQAASILAVRLGISVAEAERLIQQYLSMPLDAT